MHVGLTGGIGPAATIMYHDRLVTAFDGHDAGYPVVDALALLVGYLVDIATR